jgi:FtsH-binding integral membrane protein
MKGVLGVLAMAALGLIAGSIIFGFTLGLAFVIGMIVLACGYILFYTSNVLHHYRVTQHVAAALALFSAVALLFWYILRLFMRR